MSSGRIVWLASYPKSGNTWVRSFLTAYRTGLGKVDINALDAELAAWRPAIDEWLGFETDFLLPTELRTVLPMAYSQWSQHARQTVFLKIHDCWSLTAQGEPVFPAEATQGVVQMVRDPRDVAVSASHHWGVSLDTAVDRLNAPDYWIAKKSDNQQIPQFLSDWSNHVQSWGRSGLPRLLLRYEDMRSDPLACFRQVLGFVGWDVDEAKLTQAVNACSFERLQAQEQAQGFRERLAAATAGFFRQGQVGGWRGVLSAEQAQRIVDSHAPVMRELGYLESDE